jgi:signal transduction histidine kinase
LRRLLHRPALGLIGQVFAVLLLAILIEFGASTLLYERASQLSVRDDEARRLAEHLVLSRKLLAEDRPAERPAEAQELTTSRYEIRWSETLPTALRVPATLDRIHRQVLEWEPGLAGTDLRLRLTQPARRAVIVGGLRLPDGSWMQFRTREPLHHMTFSIERMMLALGPALFLILIGGILLRRLLLPMRQLASAAERVGDARPQPVPEGGPGEVRRVIAAFNRMQARIHRLIADRTEALAAVGHDLRTPLARMRLRVDAVADARVQEAIAGDIAEMEAMLGSLLAYLGGDEDGEAPVAMDLAVLCATLADDAADRGRDARYHGPAHLELVARPVGCKRAIGNLVDNALHYAGRVTIALVADADAVTVTVADDGPGIPEDQLESVLQPFVRLDPARARDTQGLGLGLAIVARAVAAEGGTLTLSNRPEGGLLATIRLPRPAT